MGDTPPGNSGKDGSARLKKLDARIQSARDAKKPKVRSVGDKYSSAGIAWRMTFELIAAMVIGAGMGWGLDSLFDTLPLFLIIFWLLGFASGIRTVMYTAKEVNDKAAAQAAETEQAATAAEINKRPDKGT
ncbi:AtpZ/AtpI family protein [Rhodobacteraceae bacterium NNCM2]|nr:AtpZ/AtpI family protein [Coraliihabitans acroporae]